MRKNLALACTLFGLFVSLYLLWVYVDPNHAMVCMSGTGCDEVRASRFASWFGIPTPAFGVLMYGTLVVLLFSQPFVSSRLARWIDRAAFGIACVGVAFSLYLSYLSEFVIHAWCSWCMMQAVAVGGTLFLLWTKSEPSEDAHSRLVLAGRNSAVLLLAVVIGVPEFIYLVRAETPGVDAAQTAGQTAVPLDQLVRPESHAVGTENPVVTVVEFADFQCPSCIIGEPASEEIRQRYGDRVRFVFRQFPMPKLHPYAQKAAEASECAAEQGKFWEAAKRFYAAEGDLDVPKLKQYAAELGLDTRRFNACLDTGAMAGRVAADVSDAAAIGVTGTPTFFINGQKHLGPLSVGEFAKLLINPPALPASSPRQLATSASPSPAQAAQQPERAATPEKAARSASTPVPVTPATTPAPSSGIPMLGVSGGGTSNSTLLPGSGVSSTDCDVNATAPTGPAENEVQTADAKKLHDAGAQFVDIRSKGEFSAKHIPGAVNMPLTQVAMRVRDLPRNKTIVVYESGLSTGDVCGRSRAVAGILSGNGLKDVKVYRDGLAGWEKQNLPLAK